MLIGGLIISGDEPVTVTIRARGPSLADFGVANVISDLSLTLYSEQTELAFNDNWEDHPSAQDLRSDLRPTHSAEAAITMTLEPGAYTAIVRGVADVTGVGTVEIFDVGN